MTLAELLELAADESDGVAAASDEAGMTWSGNGSVFARLDASGFAEFRLDPAVAAAARRTPFTTGSDRGPEWVRFAPAELDPHGIDRARAWFDSAARRARGD